MREHNCPHLRMMVELDERSRQLEERNRVERQQAEGQARGEREQMALMVAQAKENQKAADNAAERLLALEAEKLEITRQAEAQILVATQQAEAEKASVAQAALEHEERVKAEMAALTAAAQQQAEEHVRTELAAAAEAAQQQAIAAQQQVALAEQSAAQRVQDSYTAQLHQQEEVNVALAASRQSAEDAVKEVERATSARAMQDKLQRELDEARLEAQNLKTQANQHIQQREAEAKAREEDLRRQIQAAWEQNEMRMRHQYQQNMENDMRRVQNAEHAEAAGSRKANEMRTELQMQKKAFTFLEQGKQNATILSATAQPTSRLERQEATGLGPAGTPATDIFTLGSKPQDPVIVAVPPHGAGKAFVMDTRAATEQGPGPAQPTATRTQAPTTAPPQENAARLEAASSWLQPTNVTTAQPVPAPPSPRDFAGKTRYPENASPGCRCYGTLLQVP